LRRLSLLLPLALAITMATVPGAAAQPVSVVDANRVMHAAGALSDRIRAFHSGPGSWQGTRPLPADYCATMRAGEAALQDLTRLANKAILYRMIALARPLQRAADRLGDQLDQEEEINVAAGVTYVEYPCPAAASSRRADVVAVIVSHAPGCSAQADAQGLWSNARRSFMQRCLHLFSSGWAGRTKTWRAASHAIARNWG